MGETKDFPGMMIKKELPLIVNRYCHFCHLFDHLISNFLSRDIRLVDPSTEEAAEVEWRFDEAGENNNN